MSDPMKTAFRDPAIRENYGGADRPSDFHRPAEEHLRKVLADTLADLDVAMNLVRPEDVLLNSLLLRSWNRITGFKARP